MSAPLTRDEIIQNLGPLAGLAGTWEGTKGNDAAPDDNRTGTEKNLYRERIVFEPMGPINNHEQTLFGLKYSTTAWRIGEDSAFHEELGYWLWDPKEKQVMKSFLVPRGISVLAGGTAEPNAKTFEMTADLASPTYGLCSNRFLDKEFKTVRYVLKITLHDGNSFTYESDTQIQIKGQTSLFHHTDQNLMKRVS